MNNCKKNRIAIVVDNLNKGGIASAVLGFWRVTKNDVQIDFITYTKPDESIQKILHECTIYVVKQFSKTNPISFIYQFYKIFSKVQVYQAVHIHTAFTIWMIALAARFANVQYIVGHAHGACYQGTESKAKLCFVKVLSIFGRLLNKKLCTSMLACSVASGLWTFGKRVKFCPNLLRVIPKIKDSANKCAIKEKFNIRNRLVVGFVGCFEAQKNVELIPEIAKFFLNDSNVVFLILGDGSHLKNLLSAIKRTKTSNNIILLGYRKDSVDIMQCMDIVLAPSFSEGLSLSLLEAQLQGIHCLISKNIETTNDIGCNLIKYIEGYDAQVWAKEIRQVNVEQIIDIDPAIQLRKIGYDDKTVRKILLHAYGMKRVI